jgi:predicted RNA-binding Zn-ribbon protein involved in translation (DUF1610 family)
MIRITCTSCQKPLSIDETRLPMREVSFPCPVCKEKIVVDRRTLEAPEAPAQQDENHENELGAKAVIVGADDAVLRNATKLVGLLPVCFAEPARAREFYLQEFPQMVLIHPPQISAPPLESMVPIISLVPADRRKSFFVLVADGLRTMDGNAAFLYGVNLVVAKKDIGQFPDIYREAHAAHERLYASMNAVMRERERSS